MAADAPDQRENTLTELDRAKSENPWFTSEVLVSKAIVRALGAHAAALEKASTATDRHTKSLVCATWALVVATAALVVATVTR